MECKRKYGLSMYLHFIKCFQYLPLAAVVTSLEGKVLCLHAGLSPEICSLQDIDNIERRQEPSTSGALCDILWSDPDPDSDGNPHC